MSYLRRRPRRGRTLTEVQRGALYAAIEARDIDVVINWVDAQGLYPAILAGGTIKVGHDGIEVCPAVVMDPDQLGSCRGTWKQDHVKDDPRMGVKAPDDIDHRVCLCAAHDERGMRRGVQWNTSHRDLEREYLLERRREREDVAARAVPPAEPTEDDLV